MDLPFKTLSDIGHYGLDQYMEGDMTVAATYLRLAIDCGEHIFARWYADICFRQLDEVGHSNEETAYYYLVATDFGDGDVASWLNSVNPDFIDKSIDFHTRLHQLTQYFVVEHARIKKMEEEESCITRMRIDETTALWS